MNQDNKFFREPLRVRTCPYLLLNPLSPFSKAHEFVSLNDSRLFGPSSSVHDTLKGGRGDGRGGRYVPDRADVDGQVPGTPCLYDGWGVGTCRMHVGTLDTCVAPVDRIGSYGETLDVLFSDTRAVGTSTGDVFAVIEVTRTPI